ncbi:MAG: hypothetical protein C5B53_02500 [Candidatus Melainabacteria bacterium]|nr:MAG: hypothetical protein C5B53_02500 [Candidatus Melainabacteria bacterium]
MSSTDLRNITVSKPIAMILLLSFLLLLSALLNTIKQITQNGLFTGTNFFCARTASLSNQEALGVNSWFPVPRWLAGTWEANEETVLDAYDYKQGIQTISEPMRIDTLRRSVVGTQCDSLGRIWYCACTPIERTLETESFVDHQTIERISLVANSTTQITVDSLAKVTRSGKSIGQEQKVFKEETIATYRPVSDGIVRANFLINDFDLQGHPLVSSRATCYERQIEPFKVVDQDERGDLRSKFQEFLIENGLGNLLAKN